MNNLFLKDIFVAMFLFVSGVSSYVLAKIYTRRQLAIFNGPFVTFVMMF